MTNVNAPRGFTSVGLKGQSGGGGTGRRYYKSATAGIIGVGDPVIKVTNSSDPEGGPEIIRHVTGAAITGVVVGIEANIANLNQIGYLASADTGYVLVDDNPDSFFEVQEVTGGTPLAIANIGEHIDAIAAVDADVVIGRSKYEIDNAALATGNTFILEQLVKKADNALGEHAKWLVRANLHTERNASATSRTEV
tara:strand:+ start:4616 stop:5200 length:585 start_codon:yes stop_codon:yes gene_type:complete